MKGRVVVKIQESAENYLETIHMLSKHKPYVRSIDIANELSFSKPSVSVAMKNLRENGYIHMDDQGSGFKLALLLNWKQEMKMFRDMNCLAYPDLYLQPKNM